MNAPLYLVDDQQTPVIDPVEWSKTLSQFFTDECGIGLNPYQVKTIRYFLEKGNDPCLISCIIGNTASAFRPSFRYFETVLRNLNNSEIFTLEDYLERGEECRQEYIRKNSLHYI